VRNQQTGASRLSRIGLPTRSGGITADHEVTREVGCGPVGPGCARLSIPAIVRLRGSPTNRSWPKASRAATRSASAELLETLASLGKASELADGRCLSRIPNPQSATCPAARVRQSAGGESIMCPGCIALKTTDLGKTP
jgi:hypothetical protein